MTLQDSIADPEEFNSPPRKFSRIFRKAFRITVDLEGGLSLDPDDPGNYTGGKVGVGVLKGTKFGISAKAFPELDIAGLTQDQAMQLYDDHYWRPMRAEFVLEPLGAILFDTSVHLGVRAATRLVQQEFEVLVDGRMGPRTLAALMKIPPVEAGARILRARFLELERMPLWPTYGRGWGNRLFALAIRVGAEL